ncbi:hypothetical protein LBMAG27_24740 [Bacteroidota bacterium]|nr:hypothetical protein LBMAG27_24740 [Bacteroidota bacterium]
MLLSKELNDKITYYLLLAFAFSFPFGNIYGTIIIILISALWLLSGGIFSKMKYAFTQPLFITYTFLFLLQFVWLFNTQDFTRAFYLIKCNASMFSLPLVFLTCDNELLKTKRSNILLALVYGCVAILIVTLTRGLYRYHSTGDIEVLFYTSLTQNFYHPGFMSIHFSVCIVVLVLDIFRIEKIFPQLKTVAKSFIVAWFILFLILLSTKIGLIALTLIVTVSISYAFLNLKNNLFKMAIILIPFLLSWMIYKSEFGIRIDNAIHALTTKDNLNTNEESTALRITAIKTTTELIKNNWLLGVGTGDVWGDLRRYYFVEVKPACLKEKVIPHNQYLNSFAKFGVTGILSLLTLLFFPVIKSWRHKYWAALFFMILIILNCFVEDVFEVQNGVVFTSFFYSYFFLSQYKHGVES